MAKLTTLRDKLDLIDEKIRSLLDERFEIGKKIAQEKALNNYPTTDLAREKAIEAKINTCLNKEEIKAVYQVIFEKTKAFTIETKLNTCYLIGEKLTYSPSKLLHNYLGNPNYHPLPLSETEVEPFIKGKLYKALNITNPYKALAYNLVDEMTPNAFSSGVINTIINQNGKLIGENFDYPAFLKLLSLHQIDLSLGTFIIIGNGSTSKTVLSALASKGLSPVVSLVRTIKNHHEDLLSNYLNYQEVNYIIDTTSYGVDKLEANWLFPLKTFTNLKTFISVNYQPKRLLFDCNHFTYINGYEMLIEQAILFENTISICHQDLNKVLIKMNTLTTNIVLIGMPLSGKTTIAKLLSKLLNKEVISTDEILKENGDSLNEIFAKGQVLATYREKESNLIKDLANRQGIIIDTGGGIIEDPNNYRYLYQNSVIIFLNPSLETLLSRYNQLTMNNRPLIKSVDDLIALYHKRLPIYQKHADMIINETTEETIIQEITGKLHDYFNH